MPPIERAPRFACPDWWEKIQAGADADGGCSASTSEGGQGAGVLQPAASARRPGNPPLSEACGDWFRDILVAFLASEDPETKQRLVWELLCMVPKKNSKTTYVAALGLTALFMEEAPNRQMLLVAPSQNISERCFDQAQGMIRLDPPAEVDLQGAGSPEVHHAA
jgi:phage terminase large subunit-like protein